MIAEFSIVPVGKGSSVGKLIAKAVDIVDQSGLAYKLTAMGTIVEGDWDEVMGLIRKCHDEVMKKSDRAITTVKVDDRKGSVDMMNKKIASVEKRLHREVHK